MPIRPSQIFKALGFSLDGACSCGRLMNVVHSPCCGSTSVIVLNRESKLQTALLSDGSRTAERVFRCKQCAGTFPESTCFRACTALPITWQRESEVVDHVVKQTGGQLPEMQMDLLRSLAKKNPAHAEKIKAKLGETGLLERRDRERAAMKPVDPDTAKLFEEPVIDNGEESSS